MQQHYNDMPVGFPPTKFGIKVNNEKATIDLKRCIGCGNCVDSCPNQSISLIKRKSPTSIPDNDKDLYDSILKSS